MDSVLIFFTIPMPDDTFLQTLVMWESHERNSSSSTPRHLLQLTFFNDMPFIERSRLSVTVAILCLEPINKYSVFNMFRVSLFAQTHCLSFSIDGWMVGWREGVTEGGMDDGWMDA